MIDHDRSARSIVTVCRVCGTREIHATPSSARAWEADHLERVHAGETSADRTRAITAARVRRHRTT